MITKYTHTVYIRNVGTNERYKADVRKVRKWWETRGGRRFDIDGYEHGHYEHIKWGIKDTWRMEIETLERIKG